MQFGRFTLEMAEGVRLAHSVKPQGRLLAKGRVLTSQDVALLREAGVREVWGARLQAGELDEDEAARRAGAWLATPGLLAQPASHGRCNIKANQAGVLLLDAALVQRLNRVDAALTLATLAPYASVRAGQIAATLKTIPFAVAQTTLQRWEELLQGAAALRLAPYRPCRVGLILTTSATTSARLLASTTAVTRARLEAFNVTGLGLALEAQCAHEEAALQQAITQQHDAGAELILIVGASVSKDVGDTVPAALCAAGGRVIHFGMPVEPGNMLLYGRLGSVPVVNLPGCARSRRLNGFDWVLRRLLAGLELHPHDIMDMGAGGLLASASEEASEDVGEVVSEVVKEDATENTRLAVHVDAHAASSDASLAERGAATPPTPEHRAGAPHPSNTAPVLLAARAPRMAALVLAAGRSTRMQGANKLLCTFQGEPLVRHAVRAALGSRCVQTLVVTGYQAEAVETALVGMPLSLVSNPQPELGMSASLRCGLRALPQDVDGVVVLLGDMPRISSAHINQLLDAFDAAAPAIIAPVHEGRRGNPVLWPRRHFTAMTQLQGDQGARRLIEPEGGDVVLVPIADDAIFADVDTPAQLRQLAFS